MKRSRGGEKGTKGVKPSENIGSIKVSGNYFGDEDLHRRRGDLMR